MRFNALNEDFFYPPPPSLPIILGRKKNSEREIISTSERPEAMQDVSTL